MSSLLSHVLAENACLESLIAALGAEDQALDDRRFDELPALLRRKEGVLDRLAEIDQARESVQRQLGLAEGRQGTEAAAQSDPALLGAVETLVERAERARELNRIVAAKVYTHLQFAADALSFLKAPAARLYGRDGAHAAPIGGSSLAIG